jgi:EAL domain-containing protein (putative c-di-GMP-specific phosphodiesterase class I)
VEGVENEFQQTELDSFGCQFGQGWLFGRPQTEANILADACRRSQKALTARI